MEKLEKGDKLDEVFRSQQFQEARNKLLEDGKKLSTLAHYISSIRKEIEKIGIELV